MDHRQLTIDHERGPLGRYRGIVPVRSHRVRTSE